MAIWTPQRGIIKPGPQVPLNPHQQAAKGMVGGWLFTDRPQVLGLTHDTSGNGNNGTLVADTHSVAGKFGNALDFDGTADEVIMSNFAPIATPFTIVAGVNSGDNLGTETIASIANAAGTNYHAIWRSGTHFEAQTLNPGNNLALSTKITTANTWYQVVGVWESDTLHKCYTNAGYMGSNAGNTAIANLDRVKMGVTADATPFGRLTSQIDHVLIYNRALSAREISSLYADPFQAWRPDPIELWSDKATGGDVTVTPTALALTAAVNAPTVTGTALVTPSALSITAAVNAPTVIGSVVVSPAALPITATLNAPVVVGDVTVSPTALALTATLNAPTVSGTAVVSPSALAITAALNAPVVDISGNATVTPSALPITATLNAPTVSGTAVVSPSALSMAAGLNAPTIDIAGSVTVAVTALGLALSLKAPTILTGDIALGVRGDPHNDVFDGAII